MLKSFFPIFIFALVGISCRTVNPKMTFDAAKNPPAPDYSKLENWAAHPDKKDLSDRIPANLNEKPVAELPADVFFLYPTTLTGDKKSQHRRAWNADVSDEKLNLKTDKSAIQYQASIFNSAGRVFAPRFRQAHFGSFFTSDTVSKRQALELAYSDVRAAFEFYLKNFNNGRPIIIAGHSQGGLHGMYLLREFFDGKDLEKQLVAAYLAGWPVRADFYKKIKPCASSDETGCFCSWRTFEKSYKPKKAEELAIVCTNPLNWTTESGKPVARKENRGAVVRNFDKVYPNICDAEVRGGILLCSKPKFPGSVLIRTKNYHPGDFNLFYLNVRENAVLRTNSFLKK